MEEKSAVGGSPWRILLILVPVSVIVAVVSNLMGLWSTDAQRVARERWQQEASRRSHHDADVRTEPVPAQQLNRPEAAIEPPVQPEHMNAGPSDFSAAAVALRVARADLARGGWQFRKCAACHPAEKGAGARIGPNLWGVVGAKIGRQPGYVYSRALADNGGRWTPEKLAAFLHNPRSYIPGSKMAFRGMKDPQDIADLIAYLKTLAD